MVKCHKSKISCYACQLCHVTSHWTLQIDMKFFPVILMIKLVVLLFWSYFDEHT